ncbi:MAG TPA: cytochrome P450 [Solirubrobacteraceae bacterium]|jgi:cytochrome P450|nr:cytochrome P450 [Solirubrobacteraceae bacterium]
MLFTDTASPLARLRRDLPPAAPLPAALQTLACRWWPIAYLEWCRARYGKRFTVYPIDMPPLVFLSDPDELRELMGTAPTDLHGGEGSSVIAPLIGEHSFMLCEEDDHKYGRSAIMPAFHRKMAEDHVALAQDMITREVASWPLDTAFALHPRLRSLTLRVILQTVLAGEDERLLDDLTERLLASLSVTASFVLQEPQLRHLPGWRATWRRFVQHSGDVDERIFALIRRRRSRPEQQADLLDMLIAAPNPDDSTMSDAQVRDNLMSMILAGHETTTAELAWAFQLLAHNRPVQDRLLEEIDGGEEQEYLIAMINETLRHRPAFLFIIPRAVIKPVAIGGVTYRPPARLLGCTYLMHHDPELYPNPQAFNPDRFMGGTRQSRTWLPWGAGPKSCLGRHFALLEMQLVLRAALSRCTVEPAGAAVERERWRSAVLVPHAGSRVVLRRRTRRRRLRAERELLHTVA